MGGSVGRFCPSDIQSEDMWPGGEIPNYTCFEYLFDGGEIVASRCGRRVVSCTWLTCGSSVCMYVFLRAPDLRDRRAPTGDLVRSCGLSREITSAFHIMLLLLRRSTRRLRSTQLVAVRLYKTSFPTAQYFLRCSTNQQRSAVALAAGAGLVAAWYGAGATSSRAERRPRLEDDYELGPVLGSGHFATVRRGQCIDTGKEVAIKVVPKSRQTAASIRHEAAVLKRVSMHKRIASLEALYETDDHFYIVMEYVAGGELFDHLCDHGAMTEREAATLVSELAGAIAILHAQGVCHADIKPENLLLTTDGHVKLVDFGLSCQFEGNKRIVRAEPAMPPRSTSFVLHPSPYVRCSGRCLTPTGSKCRGVLDGYRRLLGP